MMFTSIPFRDPLYLKRKISRRMLQSVQIWQTQLRKAKSCLRSVVALSVSPRQAAYGTLGLWLCRWLRLNVVDEPHWASCARHEGEDVVCVALGPVPNVAL